ncbi:MAG: hypothetical protein HKL81_08460 [Acidimicrobiaceae bacterium]|nr:hypothetical protein [Acidimicrobiaceae bacterium]
MTEEPERQDDLRPLLEGGLLGFEGVDAKSSEGELVAVMRKYRNRRLRLWAPVGAASLVLAGLLGSALTDGSAALTNATSSSGSRCTNTLSKTATCNYSTSPLAPGSSPARPGGGYNTAMMPYLSICPNYLERYPIEVAQGAYPSYLGTETTSNSFSVDLCVSSPITAQPPIALPPETYPPSQTPPAKEITPSSTALPPISSSGTSSGVVGSSSSSEGTASTGSVGTISPSPAVTVPVVTPSDLANSSISVKFSRNNLSFNLQAPVDLATVPPVNSVKEIATETVGTNQNPPQVFDVVFEVGADIAKAVLSGTNQQVLSSAPASLSFSVGQRFIALATTQLSALSTTTNSASTTGSTVSFYNAQGQVVATNNLFYVSSAAANFAG